MKQTRSLSDFTWCPKLHDFTLIPYNIYYKQLSQVMRVFYLSHIWAAKV